MEEFKNAVYDVTSSYLDLVYLFYRVEQLMNNDI